MHPHYCCVPLCAPGAKHCTAACPPQLKGSVVGHSCLCCGWHAGWWTPGFWSVHSDENQGGRGGGSGAPTHSCSFCLARVCIGTLAPWHPHAIYINATRWAMVSPRFPLTRDDGGFCYDVNQVGINVTHVHLPRTATQDEVNHCPLHPCLCTALHSCIADSCTNRFIELGVCVCVYVCAVCVCVCVCVCVNVCVGRVLQY